VAEWSHGNDDAEMVSLDIRMGRVYASSGPDDGMRILVDRLCPRGVLAGDRVEVNEWSRVLAPSLKLRKWCRCDSEAT
jgi:uncharacterized protein YeaO (DUF488 family)